MAFWFAQAIAGLASAAILFLVAAGLSLVFGVTRIVNFAHGGFLMVGAYVGYWLVDRYGDSPTGFWLSVGGAALATAALGALFEVGVLRRLYRAPELFQLLGTFAAALIIGDALLKVFGGEDLVGPRAPGLEGAWRFAGMAVPSYDLVLIVMAPTLLALLWLLLHRTPWGVLVRAATHDREMVDALGSNQAWLFTGIFALGAFLAGLAGALQVPRAAVNLGMGLHALSDAFAVVVIGGLGSLPGAFVAAVIIGELQAFGVALFPQLTLVLTFLVMALTLVVRPQGLFGRPEPAGTPPPDMIAPPARLLSRSTIGILAAVLAGLAALPVVIGPYALELMTECLILALFAASLAFIMGPGGLASFGHACYFGLGAYAVALLVRHAHVPAIPALLAALVAGGMAAAVFGWFCRNVSGVYFAMLTLAFGQIVWSVLFQWYDVTGGDNGIVGVRADLFIGRPAVFYWCVLTLGAASLALLAHVLRTPFGYGLRATRDSNLRAEAIGLDVGRQRWFAFILAGAVAGLAGGLYAFDKGSVFPGYADVTRSLDATVMVLLGGLGTLGGALVGAAAFFGLQSEIMRVTDLWQAALGGIVLLLVLLLPGGLTGPLLRWRKES